MLLSAAPVVLSSAITLGLGGHTPLGLAAAVCCGSVLGSLAGSSVALGLHESELRQLYMASLVLLGGRAVFASVLNIKRLIK